LLLLSERQSFNGRQFCLSQMRFYVSWRWNPKCLIDSNIVEVMVLYVFYRFKRKVGCNKQKYSIFRQMPESLVYQH